MDPLLSLVWLLMAGLLPLMALRNTMEATERGRRLFRYLLIAYALAAVIALAALVTVGPGRRAVPADVPWPEPSTA